MCSEYANLAIAKAKAKLDAKLHWLALRHTKSKLTKAISKLITKIGNLGLKLNLQIAHQAKLDRVTRKSPIRLGLVIICYH